MVDNSSLFLGLNRGGVIAEICYRTPFFIFLYEILLRLFGVKEHLPHSRLGSWSWSCWQRSICCTKVWNLRWWNHQALKYIIFWIIQRRPKMTPIVVLSYSNWQILLPSHHYCFLWSFSPFLHVWSWRSAVTYSDIARLLWFAHASRTHSLRKILWLTLQLTHLAHHLLYSIQVFFVESVAVKEMLFVLYAFVVQNHHDVF